MVHNFRAREPAAQPFNVPKGDIDRLLQISMSLDLGPEMTPVQVWAIISDISTRHIITADMIRTLTGEFSKYVRCNRYRSGRIPDNHLHH